MKKEMAAEDALEILLDPDNILKNTITIPEGLRVEDITALLADHTDFEQAQFEKVLDDPQALGLPDYAEGNPEGYLFPSTYDFGPKETPKSILTTMVDRWEQAADEADLESAAAELGYTPAELMTVASLVESEAARDEDRAKVARVIYNRLDGRRDQRAAPDRRDGQLRGRPGAGGGPDHRGPRDRLAVQHLPEPRAPADPDRGTR